MSSSTPAEVLDTAVLRWQLRTGGTPLRNGTPLLLEG